MWVSMMMMMAWWLRGIGHLQLTTAIARAVFFFCFICILLYSVCAIETRPQHGRPVLLVKTSPPSIMNVWRSLPTLGMPRALVVRFL